ncbi:MAG: type II toxin-antitoxin system RelE/ParE family toxin [Candidatus Yanofskybacteria bacterium]|nr:type II toxin-antitoxin system RelE/ParE family toxin [Candidatus Yanofskybacteria bacterium]
MAWKVIIDPSVAKGLKKINRTDRYYIKGAIDEMNLNPYTGDIRNITGQTNIWRKRVGAYRIFYEINLSLKIVHIFKIERRTSTTY